ncbi:histidine phosphatase family protein [Streptococcus pneumoniae]|nr:histidine phosphatase family protein [Streptococcus pneumoniae]MDS8857848.1 histidine phosphatase family protein [Streptococcus pneumoniae]MDT5770452.1 histidine phosphatase family protein [Streptococcus pneumoniae]VIV18968.1 phosphoglycerate mutase family protein [Streptococcus pneumoniae]HES9568187.1 histidine phosphatase family protein [Streptococcus pneumoniae]
MKKTLYLMRHGQTLFNKRHLIQGWCDSPLTDFGIYQAQVASEYFKEHGIIFDSAFSSTSERACDTLEIVTDGKMPYKQIKGLKEWNFGIFEGESEELNPSIPYNDFFVYYGGESQAELQDRINYTISSLMKETEGDTVLTVSHGGSIRNFARVWENYEKTTINNRMTNCCILKFTYSNDIFYLEEVINHDFSNWNNNSIQ